jgi:hypothetical protein
MYTIATISGEQRIEISAPTAYGAFMLCTAHSSMGRLGPAEGKRIENQLKSVDNPVPETDFHGRRIPQHGDPAPSVLMLSNVAIGEIIEETRKAEVGLLGKPAAQTIRLLYQDATVSLDRKMNIAARVLSEFREICVDRRKAA